MDNSVPTSWWKLMLCGTTLAFFNIFAYANLDAADTRVWGPVKSLYGAYGPMRVMTVIASVAVLFLLAALVEKVKQRDEVDDRVFDFDDEPQERQASGEPKRYKWVDVD